MSGLTDYGIVDEKRTSLCFCFKEYYQYCNKFGQYYENETGEKGYHIPNTGCP
jgi:hypothetical protein